MPKSMSINKLEKEAYKEKGVEKSLIMTRH